MKTVADKPQLLHPTISEILAIRGAPALSLGILHQGKVVHTAHFESQDASYPSPLNNETTYRIASQSFGRELNIEKSSYIDCDIEHMISLLCLPES
jgi:hypothetical protein